MVSFEISGESGARVCVGILGYERSESENEQDANWLRATASVVVTGFTGELELALTTHDVERFRREIDDLLATSSGRASFTTDEEQIELSVSPQRSGRFAVTGRLGRVATTGAALTFATECDHQTIVTLQRTLRSLPQAFPVR